MKIMAISGSARPESSNRKLLTALSSLWPVAEVEYLDIHTLPLFSDIPGRTHPAVVVHFLEMIKSADAIVISTPEYAHNMPAALKNALEWLVAGGEMMGKATLAITLTPHPPRGERCMTSLCWTLQAVDARVISQLSLYKADVVYDEAGKLMDCAASVMLEECFGLMRQ